MCSVLFFASLPPPYTQPLRRLPTRISSSFFPLLFSPINLNKTFDPAHLVLSGYEEYFPLSLFLPVFYCHSVGLFRRITSVYLSTDRPLSLSKFISRTPFQQIYKDAVVIFVRSVGIWCRKGRRVKKSFLGRRGEKKWKSIFQRERDKRKRGNVFNEIPFSRHWHILATWQSRPRKIVRVRGAQRGARFYKNMSSTVTGLAVRFQFSRQTTAAWKNNHLFRPSEKHSIIFPDDIYYFAVFFVTVRVFPMEYCDFPIPETGPRRVYAWVRAISLRWSQHFETVEKYEKRQFMDRQMMNKILIECRDIFWRKRQISWL